MHGSGGGAALRESNVNALHPMMADAMHQSLALR